MYKHNFKIAFRHLLKDKVYSFINIFSLTVGIAACMVIFLFVEDETSFDSMHTKSDNIYRLNEVQNFSGTKEQQVALSTAGMGPYMKIDYPEVKNFTRSWPIGKELVVKDEKILTVDEIYVVDSSFLKIFDFKLLAGDKHSALNKPNSILLTKTTALQFFNNVQEAFEKTVVVGDSLMRITGILEDVPENSHLQFNALVSMATYTSTDPEFNNRWGNNFLNTYLLLEDNVDIKQFETKFEDFMIRHMDDEDVSDYMTIFLQRLDEIHLQSTNIEHDYNNYRKFNGTYIEVFSLVGLFILIIASINFMNLTTARASQRWKEVGVRKVVGAHKSQLFSQFMLESILLAMLALALAFAVNLLFVPWLNSILGRELSLTHFINNPLSIGIIFVGTLCLGFVAGVYPSLYMAAIKVAHMIKGTKDNGNKSIFRSGLVVLQFGLAVTMIVSTLIVVQQLNFMKNKDIGFNKEHMLLIDMNGEANDKFETLKTQIANLSSVEGVTASGQRLGNNFHQWGFKVKSDTAMLNLGPSNVLVDYDYLDVYGIKLKEGRTFSRDFLTDDGYAFIINEAFADELGIENPIGTPAGHGWYHNDSLGTVIGVSENFNFNSLHHKVNNLAMVVHSNWNYSEMTVKVKGENIDATIAQIERIWGQHVSEWPFTYAFLDDHFAKLYQSDKQMGSIVTIMAVLAILIACMGLFGLSSIMVTRKIKEVGIRKVLGASIPQITLLLSKKYVILILIAFIIVCPLTYYFINIWLNNFAFRININPLIFIIGALITLFVALITIGYHTIKASLRNPIEALKYE